MRKWLWIMAVILVITAGYAGYSSSPMVANSTAGGSANQQYAGNPQQYQGNPQQYGQNEDTSYFYDRLSPYGEWTNLTPYGYVWTPRHMGYRWRPYSDGHWVYTDYGWTWIANEQWGDVPFHYGRWGYDDTIGWYWVPGTTWGPAWVTWRSNDQYMGWAPLQPGFDFNVGMNFNSNSLNVPLNFWVFIQGSQFQDQNLNPYVLPFERNQTIVGYTSMHNNMYTRNGRIINEGIGVNDVRRITGRNVTTYTLQNAKQPGSTKIVGQQVQIFRPNIKQNNAAKPKTFLNKDQAVKVLAPAKVFDPRGQNAIDQEAAAALKRQTEEKRLLAITQAQDIKNLQMKRDAEAQRLRDANAKVKVQKDYEAKIADLQKSHAIETQQLNLRHQNDAVQVKQLVQTKQVKQVKQVTETPAPKGKKKKIN